ncbi:MAG: hypothetical protein ACH34Y_09415 [Brachymonas sp.]|jgi:hypothetical protein
MNAQTQPLRINARQRDMLSHMGLPMLGWPAAAEPPAALTPSRSAQPSAAPALLVDTMDPAVRRMRLGAVRREVGNFSEEEVETPRNAAQVAIENVVPCQALGDQPRLWTLQGELTDRVGVQALLLVCEPSADANHFPLDEDALVLLRNMLQALAWPVVQVVLAELPSTEALEAAQAIGTHGAAAHWLACLETWQPAAVLLLGRSACRQVLDVTQDVGLSRLREQNFTLAGRLVRASYPLSYLLRNPSAKSKAWHDWLALKWAWADGVKSEMTG